MKIRIKFAKTGGLKFIGHLDVMRYFQKLIKRAGIDIAYSEGFNPHQKLSFAQPLGVGMESFGEYADIEVNSFPPSDKALALFREAGVSGIEILSLRKLPEDAKNAMSIVAAADYLVRVREGHKSDFANPADLFINFMETNPCIEVEKETKKSTVLMDIRPYIYGYGVRDEAIFLRLSCGSVTNIKPELVMAAFTAAVGLREDEFRFEYIRLEVYAREDGGFRPLEDFGEDITE